MNEKVIVTKSLTKTFGTFKAVNEISFGVNKGEIFGFLGANGAGKTTAMKMLCGLLKPTSGEAMVAGEDVYQNPDAIKQKIGYMSQKFSLYEDLTVMVNIRFFAGIYGVPKQEIKLRAKALIDKLHIHEQADTLVASIPLGWKQKLAFSVATIHQPQIVFLDEPTGGVDPVTRRQFWKLIYEASEAGTTVFVTTHYMDEAEYCNRVSIMVDGEIQAMGEPLELKCQHQVKTMDDVFYKLARGAKRGD